MSRADQLALYLVGVVIVPGVMTVLACVVVALVGGGIKWVQRFFRPSRKSSN